MSIRGTVRALFSLTGLIFIILIAALATGGAVALGIIDVDQLGDLDLTGDGDIENVETSGDQLTIEVAENHDFDAIFIRHEFDDTISEQPVISFDFTGDEPILDDSPPRFGGNVSYTLAGSYADPGLLCTRTTGFENTVKKIDFPSNKFVVAGVQGSATDREEVETVSFELDLDRYSCAD